MYSFKNCHNKMICESNCCTGFQIKIADFRNCVCPNKDDHRP